MANIYDMADTWNDAGTIFTALKMNVTDTASASGSLLMDLQVGGVSKVKFNKFGGGQFTGPVTFANVLVGISSTISWNNDAFILRDGPGAIAIKNGLTKQRFAVYNHFTVGEDIFKRLDLWWTPEGDAVIEVNEHPYDTGSASLTIRTSDTNGPLILGTDNIDRWIVGGADGHFTPGADNTYDIGASGANRPRNVFISGYIEAAGLPTTNPGVAGRLWNDGGTVKISAG